MAHPDLPARHDAEQPKLDELGLSRKDLAALRGAITSGVPANLAIIASEQPGVAAEVAQAWTQEMAGPSGAADIRLARPETDRWTVSEIDTQILGPSSLIPVRRNLIVVTEADRMASGAADHLLRAVEEPQAPTLFVFCVETVDAVGTTLRGRTGYAQRIEGVEDRQRIRQLQDAGAEADNAKEAVRLCGGTGQLAKLAAQDPELLAAAKTLFDATLTQHNPTSAAIDAAEAAGVLAKACGGDEKARKAQVRQLVRHQIARWRNQVAVSLPDMADWRDFDRAKRSATALDAAEQELAGYARPEWVLCALFSRTSQAKAGVGG